MRQRGVVRHLVHLSNRIHRHGIERVEVAVFDHGENDRRGSHFEKCCRVTHVRVANNHVQPSVLLRIRMRLVPRVDDRSFESGLEPNLHFEEVGPLT